jgi:hypothetical protein
MDYVNIVRNEHLHLSLNSKPNHYVWNLDGIFCTSSNKIKKSQIHNNCIVIKIDFGQCSNFGASVSA